MTDLKSGWIQTGTNTPTGAAMKIAVDNPYITRDDFINSFEATGLGITSQTPQYWNGELQNKILQASSWINRYCARWFDTQTIDEQKTKFSVRPYNPQLVTVVLANRPYTKINSIWIQVLKWFIQVDVSATGYLQDFYDKGYYKIVPMLSSAGTGVGAPIPAAILDRIPLGVLWTNYTFGYGTPLTAQTLTQIGTTLEYQAPVGNRLWAPSQTLNVYAAGVLQATTLYTVDYVNGKITFLSTPTGAITADFTTNESLPSEIKEACILLTAYMIGQATQNPLGAASLGMQTFNVSFGSGKENSVYERVKQLLGPYSNQLPGFV